MIQIICVKTLVDGIDSTLLICQQFIEVNYWPVNTNVIDRTVVLQSTQFCFFFFVLQSFTLHCIY